MYTKNIKGEKMLEIRGEMVIYILDENREIAVWIYNDLYHKLVKYTRLKDCLVIIDADGSFNVSTLNTKDVILECMLVDDKLTIKANIADGKYRTVASHIQRVVEKYDEEFDLHMSGINVYASDGVPGDTDQVDTEFFVKLGNKEHVVRKRTVFKAEGICITSMAHKEEIEEWSKCNSRSKGYTFTIKGNIPVGRAYEIYKKIRIRR